MRPVADIRRAQVLVEAGWPVLRAARELDLPRVNGGEYPRYMFTNASPDIMALCIRTIGQLGVHWTTANSHNIAVSRRPDVDYLDSFIGPKW